MKYFPLILILTLLQIGCGKPKTYMVPDEFKKYFYFPKGSYWIYKNQNNEVDTLKLVSARKSIQGGAPEDGASVEEILIEYEAKNFSRFTAKTYWHTKSRVEFCCLFRNKNYFIDLSSENEKTNYSGCNVAVNWHQEDSIIVRDITYYNVHVVEVDSNDFYTQQTDPSLCYFVKNVGMIKKKLFNGTVWEIVEYKINN